MAEKFSEKYFSAEVEGLPSGVGLSEKGETLLSGPVVQHEQNVNASLTLWQFPTFLRS